MIKITAIEKQADGSWKFTWDETAEVRVVLWGEEIETVTGGTTTFYRPEYEAAPPPLEIVRLSDFAITERNPKAVLLQWYKVASDPPVAEYEIEWWSGSEWESITSVSQSDALWVYTYLTGDLSDETSYRLRVVPVNDQRRDGDVQEFQEYIVRSLEKPQVAYAIASGTLTISAG